jgi:hypothetical protein
VQLRDLCDSKVTISTKVNFGALERESPRLMETPKPFGDRVLKRVKFNRFFLLIVNVLGLLLIAISSKAQITNELYFDSAITAHLSKSQTKFGSVGGFLTDHTRSLVKVDSTLQLQFFAEVSRLEFEKVEGGYARTFQLVLEHRLGDSAVASFAQQLLDTVPRAQLRQVRKTRYVELRGNDPRWTVRILMPTAIIVSGITGIISLFYIRST